MGSRHRTIGVEISPLSESAKKRLDEHTVTYNANTGDTKTGGGTFGSQEHLQRHVPPAHCALRPGPKPTRLDKLRKWVEGHLSPKDFEAASLTFAEAA